MNRMPRGWIFAAVTLFALMTLAACVATGYDGEVGVGYFGGIYEPGGYEYGGWGPGYRVGPPRGGVRAPGRRSAPSIPQRARGGGGARGGGRGR